MKHRITIIACIILALALTAAIGYKVYTKVSHVDLDLSRLAEYYPTQNYAALEAAVQRVPVGPEGFTFVVLGDTRSDLAMARRVVGRAVEEKPVFILSAGDLVRGGTVDEYVAHHMPLVEAISPTPLIPVPGNHEEGPNHDFEPFRAIYGAERFSFDYGGCRFVGVNNGDWNRLSGGDLRYLRDELSRPGVQHKFVILHIPPRYVEDVAKSEDGRGFRWNAGRFRNLMIEMHVDQVFLGHVHGYLTETLDGIRYTITAGGGAPLTKTLGAEAAVNNFVAVHVRPGGLEEEVFRLKGDQWVQTPIP